MEQRAQRASLELPLEIGLLIILETQTQRSRFVASLKTHMKFGEACANNIKIIEKVLQNNRFGTSLPTEIQRDIRTSFLESFPIVTSEIVPLTKKSVR